MTPQALHYATYGLPLPAPADGPSVPSFILLIIIVLIGAAVFIYPWSRK